MHSLIVLSGLHSVVKSCGRTTVREVLTKHKRPASQINPKWSIWNKHSREGCQSCKKFMCNHFKLELCEATYTQRQQNPKKWLKIWWKVDRKSLFIFCLGSSFSVESYTNLVATIIVKVSCFIFSMPVHLEEPQLHTQWMASKENQDA